MARGLFAPVCYFFKKILTEITVFIGVWQKIEFVATEVTNKNTSKASNQLSIFL
jgi:hypothetical protein